MAGTRFALPLRAIVALVLLAASSASPTVADEPAPAPPPARPSEPAEPPVEDEDGTGDDEDEDEDKDESAESSRPRRAGPVVRSINEAADLLRPPSDDPYREAIDWRNVPPWQQTSFFGIRAKGTFFVYVVDCSGSMSRDLRLERAKQELRRGIGALRHPQRYLIIFFNDRSRPMPGGVPRSTDPRSKASTFAWLRSIDAAGGTDPRGAMNLALNLRPDAIFLLSDGEFRRGTEDAIIARNPDRIPIHCIDLSGGIGEAQMRVIADRSGGRYASQR